jgi:hypothetical protein
MVRDLKYNKTLNKPATDPQHLARNGGDFRYEFRYEI